MDFPGFLTLVVTLISPQVEPAGVTLDISFAGVGVRVAVPLV